MRVKFVVTGKQALAKQLRQIAKTKRKEYSAVVEVGYETEYAWYVHENMPGYQLRTHVHPGQPKFLEQPARQYLPLMASTCLTLLKNLPLPDVLLRLGSMLLNWSKPLVPVDTSKLRDSGFVKRVK